MVAGSYPARPLPPRPPPEPRSSGGAFSRLSRAFDMQRRVASGMTVEVKGAIMATSPKLKSEQAKGERELAEILGENEAEALLENRRKRDGDKAHITLAGPPDAKKAVANLADRDGISKGEAERRIKTLAAEGVPDSFRVKGVGKAESGGKVAYFLVVDWPEGRAWRESVGLDPDGQDFHITLGFGPEGDVHSVPKNRIMRASNLPMKQAATGDALSDVKQELRGGHDMIEDGNYFDYEYVSLSSEAVKDVIRRLQGAGFFDFAMDEDGDLMATRPGGIEAAVEFDSWEENGRPWTEVAVEVFDPERSGESKMASHDLRSKLIRLAHARPDLRPTLLPLLSTEKAARVAAKGDPYWMTAKFPGKDSKGRPVRKGDKVFYYPLTKTLLTGEDADKASRDFEAGKFDEDFSGY